MPVFEYVCSASHVTERLIRNRGDIPGTTRCDTCQAPALRREVGYVVNHSMRGWTNTTEKLSNLHEAALEAEYKGVDPRIAHAAKVRAEGQMFAGATRWDRNAPEWKSKEID